MRARGCRAQVLYYAVEALLRSGHQGVYAAVERPLQLAQTAAVLEILHGLVGLVRSPVSATLLQIGRASSSPGTRTHILVSSLVISWSITEVCMLLNPDNLGITAVQINCVIEPRDAAVAVRLAEDVLLN
nr:very-long-chain (3R)-3-hydroxyacyl-CoA dehydratase PASTICCINO 2A-like [Aegilops tauschii subsp. strangulata]